jgi:predicted O-methyltransferase YrrM
MVQRPNRPAELARWAEVDDYLEERLLAVDEALADVLRASGAAALPDIQVSPLQGACLGILARAVRAERILEVGTLGGYSTTWLAQALAPEGRLISLELEARHAEVARSNLARAGLGGRVDIIVGPALDSLLQLAREGRPPFDLAFVDADKPTSAQYVDLVLDLLRPDGLLVVDNVVRRGDVVEPRSTDPSVQGTRRMLDRIHRDPRVRSTVLQTVGRKGHDGMLLGYRTHEASAARGGRTGGSAEGTARTASRRGGG